MPLDARVILAVSIEQLFPVRLPKSRQPEGKKLVRNLWVIISAAAEAHTDLGHLIKHWTRCAEAVFTKDWIVPSACIHALI